MKIFLPENARGQHVSQKSCTGGTPTGFIFLSVTRNNFFAAVLDSGAHPEFFIRRGSGGGGGREGADCEAICNFFVLKIMLYNHVSITAFIYIRI
jgi:hypothetical protein